MPDSLTWVALLAHWTDFARSAVALPNESEGGRWRRAVAPVIALQAVTHALGGIDELDDEERAVGLDKAELLIAEHAGELECIWDDVPLPDLVAELIDDAHAALMAAGGGGVEWCIEAESAVFGHPGELVAALLAIGFDGDLYVPSPGVPLFRTSVAACIVSPDGTEPPVEVVALVAHFLGDAVSEPLIATAPRQVYRQFDFGAGGPVRDLVVPLAAEPPPGQPLLVPAILAGEAQPVPLPPRGPVRIGPLPVEFGGEA